MRIWLTLFPLVALAALACGETTDPEETDDVDEVVDETARVRLAHFGVFPDGMDSAVDVFVNGEASGITFSFKDTTDYVELPVGTYTFDIVPSGGMVEDSVFQVADFELEADASWAFVARGYVAPQDGQTGFSVAAFQEDYDNIADTDTRLNVFHKAPLGALDPVDVWVVDGSCTPVGDAPLLDDFAFGNVASNVDVPSGALGVGFDVGGNATVDACFQVPALGGGVLVNVYAVNDIGGNVSLVAHLPDGTSAEVQPQQ